MRGAWAATRQGVGEWGGRGWFWGGAGPWKDLLGLGGRFGVGFNLLAAWLQCFALAFWAIVGRLRSHEKKIHTVGEQRVGGNSL